MLRLVLAIVAGANLYAAYLFFFTPEVISVWYNLLPIDNVHRFLTMIIGALLSVFGLGALLALLRPAKYGAIIIMLLLMHFMIFVIDVIVLARGEMPLRSVVPEMIYFLVVSTALVRWYPSGKQTHSEPSTPTVKQEKGVEEKAEPEVEATNEQS